MVYKTYYTYDIDSFNVEFQIFAPYLLTDCGDLEIENGEVNVTSGTILGKEITVSCDQGHKLGGMETFLCTEGGWVGNGTCTIEGNF